jgi:outer membrane receptor protein involved in Fe transport
LARRAEDSFEPESLWNFEAFTRASFAGGRGTLSANLFYNAISDAQRQQTVPIAVPDGSTLFATEFANAPAARTYGMEAEAAWRIGERLSLVTGVGILRTKVSRTVVRSDPSLGKDFQRSPHLSAVGGIDWRPLDAVRLSAQARHQSGYFSDDANNPTRHIGASTVADFRAAYTAGTITLSGYVRNAFDAFYLTYLFNPTFGTAGDPREFGIGVESRF